MSERAVAILLILLAFIRILGNYFRLKSIPGPWYTGLSDCWLWQVRDTSNYGRRLVDLHTRYGRVVRLGPSSVSVSDETLLRTCRQNGQLNEPSSSDSHGLSVPESRAGGMFPESTPEYLEDASVYEGTIDRLVANFITTVKPHHVTDFPTMLHYLGMAFIDILSMDDVATDATAIAHDYYPSHIGSLVSPSIVPCLAMNNPRAKSRRRYCPLRRSRRSECHWTGNGQTIPTDPGLYPAQSATPYTVDFKLQSVIAAFVSTFDFLSKYPNILSTLKQEIEGAFGDDILLEIPRWSELSRLSYLDAVMKESTRLCSSTRYYHEAEAPTRGMSISGSFIPAKTTIVCHSEVVRHSHDIYGSHTDTFDPERWISVGDQQHKLMTQNLFPCGIPFYGCSKSHAAWLELKKATVLILRGLDVSPESATVRAI